MLLGAALLLAATTYGPMALFFRALGQRRLGIVLPPRWPAPDCEPRAHVPPGAPFSWRSPLGLGAGLLLSMADDGLGFLAALAVSGLGFGTLAPILDLDIQVRASAVAALAGTAAGNVGVALLLVWLYRRRGVGLAGAGLAPASGRTLRLGAELALAMFAVSLLHDVVFNALFGRPPVSNMEPLLDALFAEGPRVPAAIGLAIVVVGIAPLIEELVYRGVLYRAFRDRGGVALGLVGSSLVFAFAHFEPDHFLPLFLIGAALAWISERAGSLRPAIALHAFYNGLSLSLYLVGRFQ